MRRTPLFKDHELKTIGKDKERKKEKRGGGKRLRERERERERGLSVLMTRKFSRDQRPTTGGVAEKRHTGPWTYIYIGPCTGRPRSTIRQQDRVITLTSLRNRTDH